MNSYCIQINQSYRRRCLSHFIKTRDEKKLKRNVRRRPKTNITIIIIKRVQYILMMNERILFVVVGPHATYTNRIGT